jgi:hypothetical protein
MQSFNQKIHKYKGKIKLKKNVRLNENIEVFFFCFEIHTFKDHVIVSWKYLIFQSQADSAPPTMRGKWFNLWPL